MALEWDESVVVLDQSRDGIARLRFELHHLVLAGARWIVVDASAVDGLPSPAIASMLTAHRACRRRGGRLLIRAPGRRALEQLERTGLHFVLQVEVRRAG
ncbi:MAG: STAS domain-containing protein [Sporichthyaceae bacterium]